MSQRKGSIAASLFLLSAGWLIVALVATAFLLTELYSRALDNSLVETLEFHVETLTDLSLLSDTPKSEQIKVADTRFDRTGSGWDWATGRPSYHHLRHHLRLLLRCRRQQERRPRGCRRPGQWQHQAPWARRRRRAGWGPALSPPHPVTAQDLVL